MTTVPGRSFEAYWDPALEFTRGSSRFFWALVLLSLCLTSGGSFLQSVRGGSGLRSGQKQFIPDFFQDYASAKNYYSKINIYTDHDITTKLYLNPSLVLDPGRASFKVNAHPPSSILLCLPFASLNFPTAHLAWNLVSLFLLAFALAIIVRQLEIPWSIWSFAPMASLILLNNALWDNLLNGQYAPILLYLLVVIWAADRSDQPIIAGLALAVATAIKIFPVFLFLYFLVRRRWAALYVAIGASIAIALVTMTVFGTQIYGEYLTDVYPRFAWFKNSWPNASIAGYWYRLFDTAPDVQRVYYQTRPLIFAPNLALGATLLSGLALLLALVSAARKANTAGEVDTTFALAIVVMLLLSPITWPHHLLLLALPFFITWNKLSYESPLRWLFVTVVFVCLFFSPDCLIHLMLPREETASPLQSLVLFPLQCYAMLTYAAAFFPTLPWATVSALKTPQE